MNVQLAITEMEHEHSKLLMDIFAQELKNSIQEATENVLRHGKIIKRMSKNSE